MTGSPYDAKWTPVVRVRQNWNNSDTTSHIAIESSEAMHKTTIRWGGRDTTIDGSTGISLLASPMNPDSWCYVTGTDSIVSATDSTQTVERRILIKMPSRPLDLTVSFSSTKPFDASSPVWAIWSQSVMGKDVGTTTNRKVFKWFSFPDTCIVLPVRFVVHSGQVVRESVEATFDHLDTPVDFEHAPGYDIQRMVITRIDTLHSGKWQNGTPVAEVR